LNVLLASKPQAIRIDESAMVVYGLSVKGDAKVPLNPVGNADLYLKKVRELLSGHVTGSPGGYPVFLKRWTRMGQMRDQSLEQLLLLGEPEAVVAAVCAPGITDELARRAWWAMEDADNARRLLRSQAVVSGLMGPVLASYLIEHLPFETDTEKMMESVRLVLQPGLLSEAEKADLWKKAGRKLAYQVGFMMAIPDALPDQVSPHPDLERAQAALGGLAQAGNPVAQEFLKTLSAPGQTFLHVLQQVLNKPPTQDVVTEALDAVRRYYAPLRPDGDPDQSLDQLIAEAHGYFGDRGPEPARGCAAALEGRIEALRALRVLSGVGYGIVRPVFGDSTAIGSLMRRKLEPVMRPLFEQIRSLRGAAP
jgi:hypothetical protein